LFLNLLCVTKDTTYFLNQQYISTLYDYNKFTLTETNLHRQQSVQNSNRRGTLECVVTSRTTHFE